MTFAVFFFLFFCERHSGFCQGACICLTQTTFSRQHKQEHVSGRSHGYSSYLHIVSAAQLHVPTEHFLPRWTLLFHSLPAWTTRVGLHVRSTLCCCCRNRRCRATAAAANTSESTQTNTACGQPTIVSEEIFRSCPSFSSYPFIPSSFFILLPSSPSPLPPSPHLCTIRILASLRSCRSRLTFTFTIVDFLFVSSEHLFRHQLFISFQNTTRG